jgi:hypothetical protein
MQDYDVALKLLLQGSAKRTVEAVTEGTAIEVWVAGEQPKVQNVENLRPDLVGKTAVGDVVHVELQSRNDVKMPLRMAEYCLGIVRRHETFPSQIVLYVGEAPLRMEKELRGPKMSFEYRLMDIRELDGEVLLDSPFVGDNIIAILARLRDEKSAVRRIVARIAGLAGHERDEALGQLMILAGLRRLGPLVEEEATQMPITENILEHEVLGPVYYKGRKEGLEEGERNGERKILRVMMEQRFGPMPGWAEERLASRSAAEIEDMAARLLDAQSLEDFLK